MSKAHIFSKCTQNITRIVISFISYNDYSNLPPTLQAQQLPTAMLSGLPRTSHLGQPLTPHRSKFQTDNHSKISHSGYVGWPNYKQNTILFYFNSFLE